MSNYTAGYLLARLTIGMSMFIHGFIRITKLIAFSNGMVNSYKGSFLPGWLVTPFSIVLPFAEFVIGVLLLAGLFIRYALIFGVFLMMILIFGSGVLEHWDALPSQLIHSGYFIVLIIFIEHNKFAADRLIRRK